MKYLASRHLPGSVLACALGAGGNTLAGDPIAECWQVLRLERG